MTHPESAAGTAAARMPGGIPFIIVNEFAERFCFYGINSMLAIFLVQFLQFGESEATYRGREPKGATSSASTREMRTSARRPRDRDTRGACA
jgi:hypothetical protein